MGDSGRKGRGSRPNALAPEPSPQNNRGLPQVLAKGDAAWRGEAASMSWFSRIQLAGLLTMAAAVGPGCSTNTKPETTGWEHLAKGMTYVQAERVLAGTDDDMTGSIEEARLRQQKLDTEYWEMVARSKFAGAAYIPPQVTTVVVAENGRRLVFDKDHLIGWSRD